MKAVSLLLDRGADVEVICTVKFGVVSHFHLSTVLLRLCYAFLYWPQGGDTALHIATKQGQERVISLLLERGANTESKNKVGIAVCYC